jgi:hypothetical protein
VWRYDRGQEAVKHQAQDRRETVVGRLAAVASERCQGRGEVRVDAIGGRVHENRGLSSNELFVQHTPAGALIADEGLDHPIEDADGFHLGFAQPMLSIHQRPFDPGDRPSPGIGRAT